MAPIVTFVFLDTETTGLPREELNKTRITELSLIAVKRSHILDTLPKGSPRVQHKLTLCFNPRRVVQPDSTKITGLCNDLLEHESPFNEKAFVIINGFLNVLSKPVCLVAYNGFNYDFPILKRHLVKLNVSFSDDVLCADALNCFYDLETKPRRAYLDIQLEDNLQGNDAIQQIFPMPKDISKVKRRIFYEGDPKPQESYKLRDVHCRLLNREDINAHRAENDCNMMLECSVMVVQQFAQWMDSNHCRFSHVQPMTIGERI